MIIGIDIGGTTTDIVGYKDNKIIDLFTIRASDPIASASGALGKFITANDMSLSEIKRIAITGVGSSYIDFDIFGVPTTEVNEFQAIGLGGGFLSDLDRTMVVSMGTGTAIVKVENKKVTHIGGSGVGGGTLIGLGKSILNTASFNNIIEMANQGSLGLVDLTVGDISQKNIGNLKEDVTASNFGKSADKATKNDYAAGILNLIYQTAGMLSIFASEKEGVNSIVFTGKLANIEKGREILTKLKDNKVLKADFIFPKYVEYSTAIGAAVSVFDRLNNN
jgi:type II pantothenate kinase